MEFGRSARDGPFPSQLLHRQAIPWYQCPFALVERIQLPILAYVQTGAGIEGNVRKGEHGTQIIFYKQLPEHAKKDDEATGEDERVPLFSATTRFSTWSSATASRCPKFRSPPSRRKWMRTSFAKASLPDGRTAPRSISTALPSTALTIGPLPIPYTCPPTPASWMRRTINSTLFHELVHSTGTKGRLNRTFGDRFGDELYSKEELIAEMGAAFLYAIAALLTSTPTATPPHTSRTGLKSWKRITTSSFMPPPRAKSRGPDSRQHV